MGPLEALLVNDSAPETVPLLVGLKATLNDELCPAGIVNGKVAPVRTNCELLVVSADTVTLALVALMVRACVAVEPTLTLPKFTDAGVMFSCPTRVAVAPVPLRGTFTLGPLTKRSPPVVPANCGAKVRFTVTLCPPFKVIGNVGPLTENSLPVIWKAYNFVFQLRVLVSTTGNVDFAPTVTWPNETLAGLLPKLLLVAPVPPSTN